MHIEKVDRGDLFFLVQEVAYGLAHDFGTAYPHDASVEQGCHNNAGEHQQPKVFYGAGQQWTPCRS